MEFNREEIAWAAGLFEGEGCILSNTQNGRSFPGLIVRMTDEDVIQKFIQHTGAITGRTTYYRTESQRPGWKPFFTWNCTRFEGVQMLIVLFWPWLGSRRRARITEIFQAYKQQQNTRPHRRRGFKKSCVMGELCTHGHLITEESSYQHDGYLRCRACRAEWEQRWHAENPGCESPSKRRS